MKRGFVLLCIALFFFVDLMSMISVVVGELGIIFEVVLIKVGLEPDKSTKAIHTRKRWVSRKGTNDQKYPLLQSDVHRDTCSRTL